MRQLAKFFLPITFLCFACKETPSLKNFDTNIWKKDLLGCMDKRGAYIQSLASQKNILKGLGQNQIIEILGKPDFQELGSRNQRFYIYYYKRGAQCEGGKPNLKQDAVLRVRFSALDSVNEITY